ncbi:MAG: PD-(D/E)XK nuclease family protein [Cyanobacteria bacterium SID2]|nr:PD-(D/E)XK nuclease family protein [Cyanobacteria bacterium SID2]MBP0003826.1 PD-(D/E)XK nuclease family protein [Cyanobacteria bacterium SBC]
MKRTVELSISGDRNENRTPHGLTSIAATPHAAKALGVPHRNLDSLARQICQSRGWRIASPLTVRRSRFEVARSILQTRDLEGTLRSTNSSIDTLLRSGIDFDALLAQSDLSPQLKTLAQFVRAYRTHLHTAKSIDPAELFWHAARLSPEPQPLFVYGYIDPQRDRIAFLNSIAGDGSIFYLPCSDDDIFQDHRDTVEYLQKRGWHVTLNTYDRPQPPTQIVPYPNLDTEIRGVLTQVKSLLNGGVSSEDIVLVTRDETTYGDRILDIAWEYEIDVRALYAVPLSATRFGTWMRLLLDAVRSNFAFETTAHLLRHPLTPSSSKLNWPQVRLQHPDNRRAWENLGADLKPLSGWKPATRCTWVRRLQVLLEKWNLQYQCSPWARELMALYTFREGLATLSQPERERLDFDEFDRNVTDSLDLLTVPAQPGWGGVPLHTPVSLSGGKFPYVFVLGMAEGLFPAPVRDDPTLDFYTRKQLSQRGFPLETADRIARQEAVSFTSLSWVAVERLVLSYPLQLEDKPTLPSPYLERCRGAVETQPSNIEPDRIKTAASWEEARKICLRQPEAALKDPVLVHATRTWAVEGYRESHTPFVAANGIEYDRFDGATAIPLNPKKRVFSASQLTTLGQCGFKWFASQLLRLVQLAEAETELSGRLRGRLYHKTLQLAFDWARDSENLREGVLAQLERAFLEAEQQEHLPALAAWQARRREHLDRLRQTVSQESFLPENTQVLATEREFEGIWYGLRVKGILDRVDVSPDGVAIVEYKNRSSRPTQAKDATGKASLDIQLPLYVQVAAPQMAAGSQAVDAYYYSLTKGRKLASVKKIDEEALSKFASQMTEQLERGAYPVEPDRDFKACQYCCHDLVCRRGKHLERKFLDRNGKP